MKDFTNFSGSASFNFIDFMQSCKQAKSLIILTGMTGQDISIYFGTGYDMYEFEIQRNIFPETLPWEKGMLPRSDSQTEHRKNVSETLISLQAILKLRNHDRFRLRA